MKLRKAIEEVVRQYELGLNCDFDLMDIEAGVVDPRAIATILNAVVKGEVRNDNAE